MEVIVNDPAMALSLKMPILSSSPFNAREYNRGRKCSGVGMARSKADPCDLKFINCVKSPFKITIVR